MIRAFAHGAGSAVLSIRTLGAVLVLGACALIRVVPLGGDDAVNGWDALFPALTDSLTVAGVGGAWWLSWVIPAVAPSGEPAVLLRSGSRLRCVSHHVAQMVGAMTPTLLFTAVVTAGIALRFGLPDMWSSAATHVTGGTPSAFSAAGFAEHFSDPFLAAFLTAVFAVAVVASASAVVFAVATLGRPRAAATLAVAMVVWAVTCSLSPTPVPDSVDATVIACLGWTLSVPGGMLIATLWWLAMFVLAIVLTRPSLRGSLSVLSASRIGSFIVLLCVSVAAVVNARLTSSSQGSSSLMSFYAGSSGDLLGYAMVAVIPVGFATAALARMAPAADGLIAYQAIRSGSYRRWLMARLGRESVFACVFVLTLSAILVIVRFSQAPALDRDDLQVLFIGGVGLLASMLLQTTLAAGLLWTRLPVEGSWTIGVGAILALGYWFPSSIRWLNFAAPYSMPVDASATATALSATVLTATLVVVSVSAVAIRSVPANADRLA